MPESFELSVSFQSNEPKPFIAIGVICGGIASHIILFDTEAIAKDYAKDLLGLQVYLDDNPNHSGAIADAIALPWVETTSTGQSVHKGWRILMAVRDPVGVMHAANFGGGHCEEEDKYV